MKSRTKGRKRETDVDLLRCQESVGYLFRRDGLLRKALTHSSVKDDRNPSNERLEFLGDAILGMVISEYLFSMLPENDEGDLTKIKSVVVSSATLARLGVEMGLDQFLMTGKGIRMKEELPRSLIANSVEAMIAAVYLDRGMEAARHFVLDHLHPYVEEVLNDDHETKNYKSLLQQAAQKEHAATPLYRVHSEHGPDHSKSFKVVAVIGGREYPAGHGASKKEAEQEAARVALQALKSEKGRPGRRGRRSSGNGHSGAPARDRPRDEKPEGDDRRGSRRRPPDRPPEAPAPVREAASPAPSPAPPPAPATPPDRPPENGEAGRKKGARRGRRRRPRPESADGR